MVSHFAKSRIRFFQALPKSRIRFFPAVGIRESASFRLSEIANPSPSRVPKSRIRFCAGSDFFPKRWLCTLRNRRNLLLSGCPNSSIRIFETLRFPRALSNLRLVYVVVLLTRSTPHQPPAIRLCSATGLPPTGSLHSRSRLQGPKLRYCDRWVNRDRNVAFGQWHWGHNRRAVQGALRKHVWDSPAVGRCIPLRHGGSTLAEWR